MAGTTLAIVLADILYITLFKTGCETVLYALIRLAARPPFRRLEPEFGGAIVGTETETGLWLVATLARSWLTSRGRRGSCAIQEALSPPTKNVQNHAILSNHIRLLDGRSADLRRFLTVFLLLQVLACGLLRLYTALRNRRRADGRHELILLLKGPGRADVDFGRWSWLCSWRHGAVARFVVGEAVMNMSFAAARACNILAALSLQALFAFLRFHGSSAPNFLAVVPYGKVLIPTMIQAGVWLVMGAMIAVAWGRRWFRGEIWGTLRWFILLQLGRALLSAVTYGCVGCCPEAVSDVY